MHNFFGCQNKRQSILLPGLAWRNWLISLRFIFHRKTDALH
jgi:hypothetical protein